MLFVSFAFYLTTDFVRSVERQEVLFKLPHRSRLSGSWGGKYWIMSLIHSPKRSWYDLGHFLLQLGLQRVWGGLPLVINIILHVGEAWPPSVGLLWGQVSLQCQPYPHKTVKSVKFIFFSFNLSPSTHPFPQYNTLSSFSLDPDCSLWHLLFGISSVFIFTKIIALQDRRVSDITTVLLIMYSKIYSL